MPGKGFLTGCFPRLCITSVYPGLLPSFWFLLPMPRELLAIAMDCSSGPRNKSLRLYGRTSTSFSASEFHSQWLTAKQHEAKDKSLDAESGPRVRKILREEFGETLAKVTCEYLSGMSWKSDCPSGIPRISGLG